MITQQQLEQRLLAACNCLRGPVDPTDYKKAGEFFTPRPVVRLLTRMLDPKE
jgi:type I restriction-modification system DNA methylase subunit